MANVWIVSTRPSYVSLVKIGGECKLLSNFGSVFMRTVNISVRSCHFTLNVCNENLFYHLYHWYALVKGDDRWRHHFVLVNDIRFIRENPFQTKRCDKIISLGHVNLPRWMPNILVDFTSWICRKVGMLYFLYVNIVFNRLFRHFRFPKFIALSFGEFWWKFLWEYWEIFEKDQKRSEMLLLLFLGK